MFQTYGVQEYLSAGSGVPSSKRDGKKFLTLCFLEVVLEKSGALDEGGTPLRRSQGEVPLVES